MNVYFPKLRRLLKAFAVIGPTVIFTAFICFAYSLVGLTLAFSIAVIGILATLPIEWFVNSRDPKLKSDPFKLGARAGTITFTF